ncbi:hypothetical protein FAVG1_12839 [Fusarium avenaceum]|nr:hypothetical protein FAVG1_12839 [Fusarium avenaceum]
MVNSVPERTRQRARQIQRLNAKHQESGPLSYADLLLDEDVALANALEPSYKELVDGEEVYPPKWTSTRGSLSTALTAFRKNAKMMVKGKAAEVVEAEVVETDVTPEVQSDALVDLTGQESTHEAGSTTAALSTTKKTRSLTKPTAEPISQTKESQVVRPRVMELEAKQLEASIRAKDLELDQMRNLLARSTEDLDRREASADKTAARELHLRSVNKTLASQNGEKVSQINQLREELHEKEKKIRRLEKREEERIRMRAGQGGNGHDGVLNDGNLRRLHGLLARMGVE